MNKRLYRVVFNKARGMLMVVPELARGCASGSPASGIGHHHQRLICRVSALSLALWLASGAVAVQAAGIVADASAPNKQQPTILNTANGTPQVNIQTPSAGGVSRNTYSQFDVDRKGVILNNSHNNTASELGGMVAANPWLAKGEAKVILNEVNARDPSRLNGFIEVAGQKADVVIASPSGISCDGCGFINAGRATLTTGLAQLGANGITGYRTDSGTVEVTGAGMDASRTDYTDIVARSVQVNAGIWANDLRITSGTSQTDAAHDTVSRGADTPAGRPAFGVDVSQLGGMYANKIRLTGTENGVGVRNAGHIGAEAGAVVISADGRIENSGELTARDDVHLATNAALANGGALYAGSNVTTTAAGALQNDGLIAGAGNVTLQAGSVTSASNSVLAAGLRADGSLADAGDLTVTSGGMLVAQGQTRAAGDVRLTGNGIDARGSQTAGRNVTVDARGKDVVTAQATVEARKSLAVQRARTLDNRGGAMGAETLSLDASSLLNAQGELVQTGTQDLTLTFLDGMDNQDGLIGANASQLRIDTSALNNARGQVLHYGEQFTLSATDVQNSSGEFFSTGGLTLGSGALDNTQGVIASSSNLTIDTHGQALNNQRGTIQTESRFTLNTDLLDNRSGSIMGGTVNVYAASGLFNQGGALLSPGEMTIDAGLADNTAGLLRSGDALSVTTTSLLNGSTTGENLGIEGDTVNISSQRLDNHSGAILAGKQLALNVTDTLDNSQGLLSAEQQLEVNGGNTLDVTNTAGTLIADEKTSLTARALSGDGDLLSLGDLALTLSQAFTNSGRVIANGNAHINVKKAVTNNAQILAGGELTLAANKLTNSASGEISAGENHLVINNALTNKGLIDGGLTWIESGSLTNAPNGRIYGDHIAIATGALDNSGNGKKAPVIAARERLDIGAQTLTNAEHGLIYSAGDLAIGGALYGEHLASGQAQLLDNRSARIEADGNLWLNVATLNNLNDHFSTQIATTETSQRHEMTYKGDTARYDWSEVDTSKTDKYGVHKAQTADGKSGKEFYEYDYTRTVKETQVTQSDPGQIIAGGDMGIIADSVTNRNSQIVAGGTLGADVGQLINEATTGERITTDKGKQTRWYSKKTSGTFGTKTSQGKKTSSYAPAPLVETIDLGILAWQGNASVAGSGTVIADRGGAQLDEQSAARGIAPVVIVSGKDDPEHDIRVMTPDLRLPDNSLFVLHPESTAGYLIETDSRFTNSREWLGSDYMMSQLSHDPDHIMRRLGDGYYEQKLIRDQIMNLTGQRYLDGFASDEAQYQALMDNGVTFAREHNLVPGVALTAEQMALLTSDMVWLVAQSVTLPDGTQQSVLVPQVYARVQTGDVDGSGALLAGRNTALDVAGDLTSSGTLAGRERAQVSAQNISNTGRMDAGLLSLSARQDIVNTGGQLTGREGVSLSAGRDIISRSTMTTNADGQYIDRVATIFVQNDSGTLQLAARNDIRLDATQMASKGDALLLAGHDITLGAQTQTHSENSSFGKGTWRALTQHEDIGSTLSAEGNLTLAAGNNLTATAATLDAGKALSLQANNDITINAGQRGYHLTEHSRQETKGALSGRLVESHDESLVNRAVGSRLGGDTVNIISGHDLTVGGSQIAGTHDVLLSAGNNLAVATAAESSEETHWSREKKTGLSGTGGIGFSYGTQETRITDTADAQTGRGSIIGSSEGNLTLRAGNQLNVNAAELIARQDMALTGKSVSVTAAQDSDEQTHKVEQKTSGFTLALSGTAGSALNTAVQSAQDAHEESDGRLSALMATKAALSGVQAGQAGQLDAAQGDTSSNDNTIGVSLSYGSQSSTSTQISRQSTATGSSLTAGNNLSVVATDGDVLIQGSQLSAQNDILLQASRDVNLLSAKNTSSLDGKNESRGGSVGIGIGVGSGGWGISVSASVNAGKGREKGNSTSYTETTVDAGDTLRIVSGRDATLNGAVVSGDTVLADIGRNLTIASQQDTDHYDSKQQNVSAGGTFTFGSMSGSGSINMSRDKMNSDYASVQEQSGIFAGNGGFDITVGGHTQLDGAVIASAASSDKNRLDTGTLGWRDIRNEAEYSVEHQSIGMGTGGGFGGNMASSMLSGVNSSGSDEGTTRSAIESGTLVVRDSEKQTQDIASLSRDTENANGRIDAIFDREKEQKKIQEAQLIADIANQVMDVARTQEAISSSKQASEAMKNASQEERDAARADWERANPGKTATDKDVNSLLFQTAYAEATKNSDFGTGGKYQRAMQAATAAIQGLAGGDMTAALAGGAAPYVAGVVKDFTTDSAGKVNAEANLAAHAIVNAALAAAQGNNALAGAAGAATGEAAGMIAMALYNRPASDLSEAEKQTVSAFATLAAGLAGGIAGDSTASAASGAQAGKTTVENNLLGGSEEAQTEWIRQHGIDMASCADAPSSASCQKAINERDAVGLALATGGVALLPGTAQAMWALGAGANAGIDYLASGTIDPANVAIAGWVNVISMGNGIVGTVGWNAAGGAFGNWIDGKDPTSGALINGAGSAAGYGIGKALPWVTNTAANLSKGGWDPKFNPTLQKFTEIKGDFGISKEMTPSRIPGSLGDIGASVVSEGSGKGGEAVVDHIRKNNAN